MRFEVDAEKCVGAGVCVLAAPDVFDQDDDGIITVLQANAGPGLEKAVRDAAIRCPAAVIRVLD